jgi:CRISPR/Cas system-associated protein Csm6
MTDEELDIDKIIAANMTVTDHLLRDAIRGVVIDAMNKAAEREREECAKLCDERERANLYGFKECAAAIRARGEP